MRNLLLVVVGIVVALIVVSQLRAASQTATTSTAPVPPANQAAASPSPVVLRTVDEWKARAYPGSPITVEQAVAETDAYTQYVTSYYSDGLRISALLTVPKGNPPANGWPVFVWNHGWADPEKFGRQNDDDVGKNFASKGYVVFQPAYRGFAGSDGNAYDTSGPPIDSMNAIASIKQYPGVDSSKIGVGGHSLGGSVTLFDVVLSPDIKAAITVAGTFVSFIDIVNQGIQVANTKKLTPEEQEQWKPIEALIKAHGSPSDNPSFWAQYDFMAHLSDITAPMQLHHGQKDEVVPWQQSQHLYDLLKKLNKTVEIYLYSDGDHQLTEYSTEIFTRSLEFLDRYVKG
ncbi:MAG: prolyl oligopeptidase family serine peptidase [Chloroflexi bacterium]|nr:prolyl oligopeptidase family serine peptidase [Chloroflexota bacterium]